MKVQPDTPQTPQSQSRLGLEREKEKKNRQREKKGKTKEEKFAPGMLRRRTALARLRTIAAKRPRIYLPPAACYRFRKALFVEN